MNLTKDKQKTYTSEHEKIARYARALDHPARVAVIEFLLKNAGLIQGEINPPFIKYCISRDNWNEARNLFGELYNAHK